VARHFLIRLRSRLWPTRRYFELRQGHLEEQLDAVRTSVEAVAASLAELRSEQAQLRSGQAELRAGQAELRTRTRRAQGLTARVYEALQSWPEQLAQARQGELYQRAYEDPQPLISIPIPTYHSPHTLCDRALASVLAQTYGNWEAIVVGDHCTDETEERVMAIGDPRIRFHNLPVRELDPVDPWERWAVKGSVPRAAGIGLATGAWIAPLSHDDAWDPDHLAVLLGAARKQRAEVAYSCMRGVREEAPDQNTGLSIGAWPPQLGQFNWQSSIVNGALRFMRYDRVCALASEPNDWNLARRAREAGVRFAFVARETSSLYMYPREQEINAELAARGLPPEAVAYP
jgi:hypothetical protein